MIMPIIVVRCPPRPVPETAFAPNLRPGASAGANLRPSRLSHPVDDLAFRFRGLNREAVLGFEVPVATTVRSRLLGLAHLDRARAGTGLFIPRCSCVHTLGMRFHLDLYFLDAAGAIVVIRRAVQPRRLAFCGAAAAVLEVPARQGGESGALRP